MKRVVVLAAMTVVLVLGNGAQARVSLVMNGSFENDGRQMLDITGEAPTHWCDVNIPSDKFGGRVNTSCNTHGHYSLTIYSRALGICSTGDMAMVSQQVYVTKDANQIIFDLTLASSSGSWDPYARSALLLIDGSVVWNSNDWPPDANGEYRDQTVDVNEVYKDANQHTLSLAIRSNVTETTYPYREYRAHWDFVKFDTHCGGFGYLPEDLNHDCYVNMLDLEVLAGRWLAEEGNQKYDLFQDDEAIVNFHDFAVFASYWQDNTCQQSESCGGSDFDRNGTVDFADFMIFAGHWLTRVPGVSDLSGDGVVNFKDFARLGNRWRDNTDWKNWGDDNCFEVELPAADLNDDGVVNWRDFALLAGDWMGEGSCIRADIDSSGVVDYGDLSKLADQWLLKSWLYGLE